MTATEELTAELRELTKQLLAYGARMPKELMLFVKNILFLDGAVSFAPDIDLLGEITSIATYFAERYGGRIADEIGIDPRERGVDLTGVRATLGLSAETESISHREPAERGARRCRRSSNRSADRRLRRPSPGKRRRSDGGTQ